MRRIIWSARAKREAESQFQYLEERSLQGLMLVRNRLSEAVSKLADMPVGRPSKAPGAFEKHVLKTSLIIVYELPDENTLVILRIVHTSQDRPELL